MDIDKIIGLPYETVMAEHDALVEENQNKQGKFQNPGLKAKQLALKKERFQSDCEYLISYNCNFNFY